MDNADAVQMTREGYEALQAELKQLKGRRPEIALALKEAMADKDFRENAPLDAARDRQAHVEARIRDLENQVRMAEVVERPGADATAAQIGSAVVLFDEKYKEEVRYTIVSPSEADPRKGRISAASPTGRALIGRSAGEQLEVETPGGLHKYKVIRIEA